MVRTLVVPFTEAAVVEYALCGRGLVCLCQMIFSSPHPLAEQVNTALNGAAALVSVG